MSQKKIKVLIVDDSALVRQILVEILKRARDIEVVGTASDPFMAREKIKETNPDVLTLDVEMPRMDGLTFLANLMRLRPMPVVMISSLTERGADTTLKALELGAFDFVSKPKVDVAGTLADFSDEILSKIRAAAGTRVVARSSPAAIPASVAPRHSADAILPAADSATAVKRMLRTTDRVIAIGASTGGTEAIRAVLTAMPADSPAIVIAQHIPAAFSGPFAKRMDGLCALRVSEPVDGQYIMAGHVYIAPGGRHLLVERDGARYRCRLNDGPPVNRHCPSVDVLFRSVASQVGPNAVGVILTGMGDDGARGLKEMHDMGAPTLAQDETTSVVWGMPGAAVKLGAVDDVLPLNRVAAEIMRLAGQPAAPAAAMSR
ncbi:MAG TPA: chemotaxis response regulator protein-glutamate methylesterase [Steroidobacteraceae bacterium]|nr:chemotaxis response regulator protein-glutamate methylesterase [Steroidobacteraceae bacterium]